MPETPDNPGYPATDEPLPGRTPARPELDDFRRRVDEFWSDPRAAELRQRFGSGPLRDQLRALTPSEVVRARASDALASRSDQAAFRLEKSLTYHDGQLVSISGDDRPLAPDERILVVTTTTTLVDSESVAVETDVFVFEREE